ncbi:hypothetical protein [Blastococcus deserti]|uniref:Uncharacterized protein n=1 Tax=Blastococcus deserti TaxID=2259033 RepID=A0ABW4XJT3_9ACTN
MTLDDQTVPDLAAADLVPAPRASVAWTEPGALPRGPRPRSEYWDVESARWVARSPVPGPRRGD